MSCYNHTKIDSYSVPWSYTCFDQQALGKRQARRVARLFTHRSPWLIRGQGIKVKALFACVGRLVSTFSLANVFQGPNNFFYGRIKRAFSAVSFSLFFAYATNHCCKESALVLWNIVFNSNARKTGSQLPHNFAPFRKKENRESIVGVSALPFSSNLYGSAGDFSSLRFRKESAKMGTSPKQREEQEKGIRTKRAVTKGPLFFSPLLPSCHHKDKGATVRRERWGAEERVRTPVALLQPVFLPLLNPLC